METIRNKVCSLVKTSVDDKTYDINSKWSENYLILFNEKQSELNGQNELTTNNDCGQIGFVILEKRNGINQQLLFKNSRKFSDCWKFENGFIFFKNIDILLKLCERNYDPVVAVCKFYPKMVKKLHFPTIGSIKTPIICDEIQDSIAATHAIKKEVFQLLPLKKQAIFSQIYYCPNINGGKEIAFKTYAVINFIHNVKVVPPRPLVQTTKNVQADWPSSPIININGTNMSGIKVLYVANSKPKNPSAVKVSTTQVNGHTPMVSNAKLLQNETLNKMSISATKTKERVTPINNSLPAQVVINIDSDSDIPDDYEETYNTPAPVQCSTSTSVPKVSLQPKQIVRVFAKSPVQKVPTKNITGMENFGASGQLVSTKQITNINSSSSTSTSQNIINVCNMQTNTPMNHQTSTTIQPLQNAMPPNIILQAVRPMQGFPQQIAVPSNCLLNYGNFNTKTLNSLKTNSFSAMKKVQTSHFAQNIQEINYCNTTVINMFGNNVPFHLPTFNSGMVVQPFPRHVPFQNYHNQPHMFKQRVKHRPPAFHPYRFPTLQTINTNTQQHCQMLSNVPTPFIENQPPKSLSPPKDFAVQNQSNDQLEQEDEDCMIIDEDEFSDKNEAVGEDPSNRCEIISDKEDVLPQTELDCFLKENPDVEMLVENCTADPNDIFYGFSDDTSESTLEKNIKDLENANVCENDETTVVKTVSNSDKDTSSTATATYVTANSSGTLTSEEHSSIGYSNILQDNKNEAPKETARGEEATPVDENNNLLQEKVGSTEAVQVDANSNAGSSETSCSPKVADMNFDRAFSKRYVPKTSTPSKTVETCPVDIYLERRSLRPCRSKCCDDGSKRNQNTVKINLCKSTEIQNNNKSIKSKTKDKLKRKSLPKKKYTKKDKTKQTETDVMLKGTSPSTFYKNKVGKSKTKKAKKKGITVDLNKVADLNKALDNIDENDKTLVSPPRFMEDMSFASLLATPETPHSRIVTPKKLVPKLKLKKTAAKSKKKKKLKSSQLKTSVKELQSEDASHAVAITSTPQSISSASLSSSTTLKPIDFHGRALIQTKKAQPRIIFHTSSTAKTDPRNKNLPVPEILQCKWKSEMKTLSPDILVEAKWDGDGMDRNIREHTKPSSGEDSPNLKIIIPTKYKKTTSDQKPTTPKKQIEHSAGPSTGNPNSRVNFLFLENRNVVSTPPISVIFSDADAVMDSIPLGLSPAYFRDYENDLNANYKGISRLTSTDDQQQNQSLAFSDDPEPLQTFPTNIDWGKQQSKVTEFLATTKGNAVKRKEALIKILNKQTENLTITQEKDRKRNKLPSCERIIQTLKETKLQRVKSASKEATPTKSNLKRKDNSDKSGKEVSFDNRLCFPTLSEDVANKCLNETSGPQNSCDNCPYNICDKSSVKANSIALCDRQSCKALSPNLFCLLNALQETVLEETSTPYADEFCLKFLLLKFGYGSVFASFEVIQEKLQSLRKFFEASPHSCKLKLVVTGHEELLCLLRKLACSNYSIQKMWHCVGNKLSLIQVFVELNKISTKARYLHKNLLKIDGFSNLTSCPLALEKLGMTLEQLKSKGDGNSQNRMERLRMDYESLTMVYAFKHFEIETQITNESEAIYKLLTCEQKIFINEFLRGMSRSCDVVLV